MKNYRKCYLCECDLDLSCDKSFAHTSGLIDGVLDTHVHVCISCFEQLPVVNLTKLKMVVKK